MIRKLRLDYGLFIQKEINFFQKLREIIILNFLVFKIYYNAYYSKVLINPPKGKTKKIFLVGGLSGV